MRNCLHLIAGLTLLFAISLLTACGFQLRGHHEINNELTALSVVGRDTGYVRDLTRALESYGIKVEPDAPYRIDILDVAKEVLERTHSSVDGYEVLLQLKVVYQLETRDGLRLFTPTTLTAKRYVSQDANLVNASIAENSQNYRELNNDLLFRIINRVTSIPHEQMQQEIERAHTAAEQATQNTNKGIIFDENQTRSAGG